MSNLAIHQDQMLQSWIT